MVYVLVGFTFALTVAVGCVAVAMSAVLFI
jgi:hypothetical protein